MIVETYARRFSEYSGQTFGITGARPEGERDVKVQSEIRRPDGPPVAVTWRVRDRGGSFEIVDVEVEGVSMGVTQRNEFSAVIQRNGGSIDALLDAMRQQIQSAQSRT
jgi:phospholipid transport system substrate-binding protein